ncbi:MAG TPA: amino acid ABC transporter substrate-binding protein [Ilumatobacter sp.]|nr:amino acid ABC transporter substrate-binding protein [Ilumatobacter sp.]
MISRGSTKHWQRAAGAVVALAFIAGACGGDDDDAADDTAVESDDTTAETTGDSETTEAATDDTVEVTQGGSTLDAVREAGVLKCGVNDTLPGFGAVDEAGAFVGFDIDFCRVIAAAVLGDSEAVDYTPLTADTRFTALQSGEVDVLIRNTTWTATRDGSEGLTFLKVTFFDGQGMMVPTSSGLTTLEDLADANICVTSGTTTELNLATVFASRGIPYNPVVYVTDTELREAYESGQCEAWTTDASGLAAWKNTIEAEGGEEQLVMQEIISKEPLGPSVRDGDTQWAQVVDWATMSTIQAWEYGIDSTNVDGFTTEDIGIQNFLGQADWDPGLGLDAGAFANVISQVGNYQEIYERHVTPLGLPLEGSVNDLWTNGGLMYVPPFR